MRSSATALAGGRGRTSMGENGRGVHCDGSDGADPQFFVMDLNTLAKPERRIRTKAEHGSLSDTRANSVILCVIFTFASAAGAGGWIAIAGHTGHPVLPGRIEWSQSITELAGSITELARCSTAQDRGSGCTARLGRI